VKKLALLFVLVASSALAELRLPHVFSDHMVLQAGTPVKVWGWGEPDQTVTVEICGQVQTAVVASDRHWTVTLEAMKTSEVAVELCLRSVSSGGHVDEIRVSDVLIGEVWLASGQSNMEMQLKGKAHGSVLNADTEIARANLPSIRMFVHDETYSIYEVNVPSDVSQSDRRGSWHVCSPESVAEFSAIGYFFARDLVSQLKTPVGILSVSVGGTPIEAWTSYSAQRANPLLQPMHQCLRWYLQF
jgi:sialate O-acetylesterase